MESFKYIKIYEFIIRLKEKFVVEAKVNKRLTKFSGKFVKRFELKWTY
jgi:hypothetical protein